MHWYLLLLFLILLMLELGYFKLAGYFNIIDKPNHRSSHDSPTIRGGGIIFPIGLLLTMVLGLSQYPIFMGGLLLISTVSFIDDLRPLSSMFRLLCHLLAVTLLLLNTEIWTLEPYLLVIAYILVIGSINAYNFMDGINGIIVLYSLVAVLTLYYINEYIGRFTSIELLGASFVSLVVFGFFNFRRMPKCFAGDVGSVSMAFIILFFILTLIAETGEIKYLGMLLVFGLDTITTIIFRIIRRENLLVAHRSHFYQYLVNVRSWPHLIVASLYAALQLIVNLVIITNNISATAFLICCFGMGLIVLLIRLVVEGREYLLNKKVVF